MALLSVFSCIREETEVDLHGQTVSIHISPSGLQQTKAITPGDGIGNDGGGFLDDYMCFEAPSEGTLNLWVSSTSGNDKNVCVREGGNLHTYGCGTSTGRPVNANISLTGVNKGTVTIFPSGGPSRLYKIEYTYVGSIEGDNLATPDVTEKSYIGEITLTWDFGDPVLKDYYVATSSYYSSSMGVTVPSIGDESVWSVTINNLTIWSMGKGKWVYSAEPSPSGYFEWIGYYKDPTEDPYNWKDNLVILIAKNNDDKAIVAKYPSASAVLSSSNEVEGTITFSDIAQGDYTVYAFGNTSGLWTMTTKNVDESGTEYVSGEGNAALLGLTTKDQVESLRFATMTRNTVGWEDAGYASLTPTEKYDDGVEVKNGRLPMTARAALKVSAGHNGEAYLELIRPVAKVTAIIKNNTGEALTLYDYKHTVHNINPTTGYVLPHDDDCIGTACNLLTNPNIKYAPYDVPIPVSLEGSQKYDWYVFPSPGPYTICLQFTLFKGVEGKEKTYTYNALPVTNWKGENIVSLGRNQHITVETRISKGLTVSFNFRVDPWIPSSSTVEFD